MKSHRPKNRHILSWWNFTAITQPGRKNTKLAYNLSKKGQTVILVDKIQSTLILLKGGKEIKTFSAEFGKSWMGDKLYSW
jgi:hypothetical protein